MNEGNAMPLFYFDINDGKTQMADDEGQELASLEEARKLAVRELALIMRDEMPDGRRESYVVTVRDQGGAPVYVATATLLGEPLTR